MGPCPSRQTLLIGVTLAALLARLALAVRLGDSLVYYDEHDYHRIALNLLAGAGFAGEHGPTGFRPPAQPLFLAAVYGLLGPHPLAARVVQALLLTLLVPLSVRLARLVSRREQTATLAGTLVALHPGLSYASVTLYPVALTALAVSAGVWAAASAVERRGTALAALAGCALGTAALATPYFAPLGAVAALLALGRRRWIEALLVATLAAAPTIGWSWRNAAVLGAFTPGTHAGFNLALGANHRASPRSGNAIDPDLARQDVPDDEVARDAAYRESARAWIAAHPDQYAMLALGRALAVADSVGKPVTAGAPTRSPAARIAGHALLPLLLAGLVGLALRRRRPAALLTAVALGLVVLSAALTIVKPRFRFPVDPLLLVFAAVALQPVLALVSRRRPPWTNRGVARAADEPPLTSGSWRPGCARR